MTQNCEVISDTAQFRCFSCPAVPAVPARPPTVAAVPGFGWDSAARSRQLRNGNVYTEFVVSVGSGAACGLAPAPYTVRPANLLRSPSPAEIAHGFMFEVVNGLMLWSPIEYGVRLAAPVPALSGATWRVQRYRDAVTWLIDGVPVLRRPALERGRLMVVGALYSSFDMIGTEGE